MRYTFEELKKELLECEAYFVHTKEFIKPELPGGAAEAMHVVVEKVAEIQDKVSSMENRLEALERSYYGKHT